VGGETVPYRGFESLPLRQQGFRRRSPTFNKPNQNRGFSRNLDLYTFARLCYNSGVERG
jgi:hypothetical protein